MINVFYNFIYAGAEYTTLRNIIYFSLSSVVNIKVVMDFRVERMEGADYIIPSDNAYKVSVMPGDPAPFGNTANVIVNANNGDLNFNFEFIGINMLNEQGLIIAGSYEEVIDFFFKTHLKTEVEGYSVCNYDFEPEN